MASELDDGMLEPNNAYHSHYKEEFKHNAEYLFDELTRKSGVDVEANKATCRDIRKLDKDIELTDKQRKKLESIRSFLIVLTIIFILAAIIIYFSEIHLYKIIVFSILVPFAIVTFIVTMLLHFLLFKKKIKSLDDLLREMKSKREALIKLAYEQMAPLNALFDWNIPAHLIEKTVKIIEMDQYFDAKKAAYLEKKYGFNSNDEDTSTVYVQSGSILGNPFLLCKDYCMQMYNKRWSGSITIHWTTTVHTKDGTRTVHHTQTLTAYVYAPAPSYYYVSYLVYGNDAAPKLSFTRTPSGMTGKTDKEVSRFVKKKTKANEKKAEKALLKGKSYQQFGNEEFEALFGGTDRDNELEYRLLFTPLAQKNLINLIRNGKPYGDDFKYSKSKCLNYIQTKHGQKFNYYCNPTIFINYDWEASREFFITYNCAYFESFYFELAPLMCIPLYQQHKSVEYMYEEDIDANFSEFEYEQMANMFNVNDLKHEESITGNIYKTERINTIGNTDRVTITAHSFRGERRVTYITKWGGDGRPHTIPVHWIEYFPVERDSEMIVSKAEATRYQYNAKSHTDKFRETLNGILRGDNNYHFERCVFASLIMDDAADSSIQQFDNVLTEGTTSVQTLEEMLKSIDSDLHKLTSIEQVIGNDVKPDDIQGEAKEVAEADVQVGSDDDQQQEEKPENGDVNIEGDDDEIDDDDDNNSDSEPSGE